MKMGDGLKRESQNGLNWNRSSCANSTAMGRHSFQHAALNILHSQACPQLPWQCLESTAGLPGTGEQGMMTGAVLPCVQETSLCNSSDRSRAMAGQNCSSPARQAPELIPLHPSRGRAVRISGVQSPTFPGAPPVTASMARPLRRESSWGLKR